MHQKSDLNNGNRKLKWKAEPFANITSWFIYNHEMCVCSIKNSVMMRSWMNTTVSFSGWSTWRLCPFPVAVRNVNAQVTNYEHCYSVFTLATSELCQTGTCQVPVSLTFIAKQAFQSCFKLNMNTKLKLPNIH